MKLKNEKGITIISLIVVIIILTIITFVTISISINYTEVSRFENVETYMLLIQTRCEYLSNKLAIGEIEKRDLYGKEQTSGDKEGWYKLEQTDLNAIGVKDAKESDGYYVNYETNDVFYEKGIENQGVTYHSLSDIIASSRVSS